MIETIGASVTRPMLLILATSLFVTAGGAAPAAACPSRVAARAAADLSDPLAEAERRFGIPVAWLWAVMGQESGCRAAAISPKGAMGLMQLMPDTWRELSVKHRLGQDPFEPRANILAGAAYLRRMYDRFGSQGFLAAYNAGPERYAKFLSSGQPLPVETRVYLARLGPVVATRRALIDPGVRSTDWRSSALFTTAGASGNGVSDAGSPNARDVPVWP